MNKTPNYIKKSLQNAKEELLKNKKLQHTRDVYIQKLKEIFKEQVIELKESHEANMSSTGTGGTAVLSTVEVTSTNNIQKKSDKNTTSKNIIFLNNEIINQNFSEIEEANNSLAFTEDENIIELQDEINEENENIIELKDEINEENENIIELKDEINEEVVLEKQTLEDNNPSIVAIKDQHDYEEKVSSQAEEVQLIQPKIESDDEIAQINKNFSSEQLEMLNVKINDLDLNSTELSEKLDELLDQKNLFSEKFNDELDIKLTEALNRTEDNLENKLNNVNNEYHNEFVKYEDEANKNFAHLENQITQINEQYDNIQNNINLISSKIEKSNDVESKNENNHLEKQFAEKINDLKNYNIKIEDSLNNINTKVLETLEKISNNKNETNELIQNIKNSTENQITEISKTIQNIEPEIIKNIEEKQKNKSESEKLQDKFDQLSKVMDMQNMRMLQMYHSSELQNSHGILKDNMSSKNQNENKSTSISSDMIREELKKELFPQIQKDMEKQFDLLKKQLSEYEIKSILDKMSSADINKEFKKPTKKFDNLFDAQKYVKSTITKKSKEWIKNNEHLVEEIAKKLLVK